jgi:hypothetical protein
MTAPVAGGCQCGAVRFAAERLGRASVCHCRMCQKAFGAFFGPLVTAHGLAWTRGAPKTFASSNKVTRGFCGDCGTPLTYDYGGPVEIAIGALDDPAQAAPTVQLNLADKLAFVDGLAALPVRRTDENAAFYASIVSYQHPDRDTDAWPPGSEA